MTYVLIVISWLGGTVIGAAISTQEFTSAERCEAAKMALIDYSKARGVEETLRPICAKVEAVLSHARSASIAMAYTPSVAVLTDKSLGEQCGADISASSAPALGLSLWNMASSIKNSSLSDFYFGGCSSPRNQPTASDFIGSSDGMAICST